MDKNPSLHHTRKFNSFVWNENAKLKLKVRINELLFWRFTLLNFQIKKIRDIPLSEPNPELQQTTMDVCFIREDTYL